MTRPAFSAALIAELRSRVIAHNEASPDKVTLNQLKKLYERAYKGPHPGERALAKVDDHLNTMAKAFDPKKHPRRKDGKFGGDEEPEEQGSFFGAEHVKRAAGAAADAAASAAESVKRGAHQAAYYAGIADEPLKPGVKAPTEVPLNLPGDRDEHRALQAENAGYAAFTSDAIPEQRGEILGSLVRSGVAVTGGLLVAHVLTSKNPNTATRRQIVRTAAYPVGLAAKIALGIPLHSVAAGLRLAENTLGVKLNSARAKDFAADVADAANVYGKAGAARAFNAAIHPMRWGTARFLDVMEGRPRVPPKFSDAIAPGEGLNHRNGFKAARIAMQIGGHEIRARAGRAAALTMVAAVPAYLIDRAIAGSVVDPVAAGRAYDQTSYRIVQKLLPMPELEYLQKALTADLRKAVEGQAVEDVFDGVANALKGRLFNRARGGFSGTGVGSLAGSGVGALTGAASNASLQAVHNALGTGNPYHDEKGRFTSKAGADNSVSHAALVGAGVGAGLGAVAGGIGTRIMIGHVNRNLFHSVMDRLDRHVAAQTTAAMQPAQSNTVGEIKKIYDEMHGALNELEGVNGAGRKQFIENYVAKDTAVQDLKADIVENGRLSPRYFKKEAVDDINERLAGLLVQHDEMQLPDYHSGTKLQPISQVRGDAGDIRAYAAKAIGDMDAEQFAKAIANVRQSVKDTAISYFEMRDKVPAQIDAALKDHLGLLDKARAGAKKRQEVLDEAQGKLVDAKAKLDAPENLAEGEGREAAQKAHDAAERAVTNADKALETAKKKIDELKSEGPAIMALGGRQIRPPSKMDLDRALDDVRDKVKPRAAKAFDNEVKTTKRTYEKQAAAKRAEILAAFKLSHARELGIAATLGRAGAGMSKIAGKNSDRLFVAQTRHDAAVAEDEAAEKHLLEADGALAALKKQRSNLRMPKKPKPEAKARIEAARASLDDSIEKADKAVKAAETVVVGTKSTRAVRQRILEREADSFRTKYAAYKAELAAKPGISFVPPEALQEMAHDAVRVAKAGYDPVLRYAIKPTGENLKKLMAWAEPHWRAASDGTQKQVAAAFRSLLLSPQKDPETGAVIHTIDPWKVGMLAGTGAIASAAEFLHATSQYARARLAGDTNAKAPTNLKVEVRRHATNPNEGMIALHAADPRNKGERIVLFGQIHKQGQAEPININPGARLSDVLNQGGGGGGFNGSRPFGEGNRQQDAGWLDKNKSTIDTALKKLIDGQKTERLFGGGTSLFTRKRDETEQNGAAGEYISVFRGKFINDDLDKSTAARNTALESLFSKQSAVLKPGQIYSLLTGYLAGGEKKGAGVFKANEDFGSSDAVEAKGALDAAVSDILKSNPGDATKEALRKAVIIVGHAKRISSDDLKPIFDKINGDRAETVYSAKAAEPLIPVTHVTAAAPDTSPHWSDEPVLSHGEADQALHIAKEVGKHVGLTDPANEQILSEVIGQFGAQIAEANEMPTDVAVRLVGIALRRIGGDGKDKGFLKNVLRTSNYNEMQQNINRVVTQYKKGSLKDHEKEFLEKAFQLQGADFDDFDVLMKRLPGLATDAGESAEAGATPKAPTYNPLKDTAAAAADLAAGGTANYLLDHKLPKVAPWTKTPEIKGAQVLGAVASPIKTAKAGAAAVGNAFSDGIGGGVRAAGRGAGTLLTMGAKGLIAGGLGAALYSGVQAATGGDSYRRKASAGENLALGAGNFAGNIAGEAAGGALVGETAGGLLGSAAGPVGTILGGAAGGALGELLTHATLQHFAGYDSSAVKRVLSTRVKPTPGQETAAQAGEVTGGAVGNALGGAGAEGLGGAVGSSLAILSNKLHAAKQELSGRPKQSQGSIP